MNRITFLAILVATTILFSGCIETGGNPPEITPTPSPAMTPVPTPPPTFTPLPTHTPVSRCGDGICDDFERTRGVCPDDCPQTATPTPPRTPTPAPTATPLAASSPSPTPSRLGTGVLYVGLMVHAEGWDDDKSAVFARHSGMIDDYAKIFEAHSAKMTIEVSPEFVAGCKSFNSSYLEEMERRGHGIGVHADAGDGPGLTQAEFVADITTQKANAESLDVSIRHVSGVCSPLDWVSAVDDAGYTFTTGGVAYCMKTYPPAVLPPEYAYVRACRTPGECHQSVPATLEERMHPWRMGSDSDWLTPAARGPVYLASSSGMACMDEAAAGNCELTRDDILLVRQELHEALNLTDPDKINIYYLSWSIGSAQNETLIDEFLDVFDPYVASGRVQWKTLPEMYDSYAAWERTG